MQMSTKKREKRETLYTPIGVAVWPSLNAPEKRFAKDDNPFGDWKTGLRMKADDPEVQAFLAMLQERYDASVAQAENDEEPKARAMREKKGKSLRADTPWHDEFDDAGKPTGFVILNLKRRAGGTDEATGEPYHTFIDLKDAAGNDIDRAKVRIGGGSRIRCAFGVNAFFTAAVGAGISLRLLAVQVIERQDAPARSYGGFGKVEGGFTVQDDTGDDETTGPMDSAAADTEGAGDGSSDID